ncbi:hypothetical protein [Kribbella sp. NPDC048928]|uniref:hypothetical protein n=1 Tax=Kribbella sp. NPDC048928 TaxID=3364111 RepID=UPI00372296F7
MLKPILVCVMSFALAACGTSPKQAAAPAGGQPSPSAAASSTPTPTPSPTPTIKAFTISAKGPLRVGGGMTKPKQTLRFGRPAIVPVEFFDDAGTGTRGVVSIVAQRPQKAPAKLAAQLGAEMRPAKGQVVYYAPIVITNVSDIDLTGFRGPRLTAMLRSGGATAYQIGLGGVAGCDPHGAALQLGTLGSSDTTCVIGAVSPKDPLGRIQYLDPPYGNDDEFVGGEPDYNKFYDLGAISWR